MLAGNFFLFIIHLFRWEGPCMKRMISLALIMIAVLTGVWGAERVPTDTLKVGMMPAVDSAPFFYALQEGIFTEYGVDVELILFTNAQNRQTALQTGQIDGAMTDLVALITNVSSGFALKGTLSTDGLFPLLARSPLDSGSRISIGLMEISVTNYLVSYFLEPQYELERVFINEIPARLEALAAGRIDSGIFPEPFASIGELRGLEKLIFEHPAESMNLIAFTDASLKGRGNAIMRFHQAYRRAVSEIIQDPELARRVIMDSIPNLPPEAAPRITLPHYTPPSLPEDNFIQEIITWTEAVTGKEHPVHPDDLVDRSFLRGL